MVGEPCNTDTECCGFTCQDSFNSGVDTCQYLGGCRPMGELCRKDTDCCNNPAVICNEDDVVSGLSHHFTTSSAARLAETKRTVLPAATGMSRAGR